MTADRRAAVNALARNIAERMTGMPAYLVDDETWGAALDEAEATYVPPKPKTPLQAAIDSARYPDPVASIKAINEARRQASLRGRFEA